MALHDNPPHTCSLFTSSASRDLGGGSALTYTAGQASIPCSINTVSASEREMFAQQGLEVSHVVAVLTSKLTTAVVRGMKLTDEAGLSYHIEGVRTGRSYSGIPAFTYIQVRQLL